MTGHARLGRITAFVVCAALVAAACSSSAKSTSSVAAAEARVATAQKNLSAAQQTFTEAGEQFCTAGKDYVTAVDRYGKVFSDADTTVGDVKTAGADLTGPRASVTSAANALTDAHDGVASAQQELADANTALASAKASASSVPTSSPTTAATTTTLVSQLTVDRVEQAESELTKAEAGVTDQTPLAQAGAAFNSAAVALEVTWLQLLAEANCLSDEQQAQAVAKVREYTIALQTQLQLAGYYTGKIDGVYGTETLDAVKKLQAESELPTTGFVDRATALALEAKVQAIGSDASAQSLTQTAALQSVLKVFGYWTGPIDGEWTPELTDALEEAQTALGVPPTGEVDAATLNALEQTIAQAKTPTTATSGSQTSTTVG
jgi:peptidoglycan hydrolase-like protein with peptidoglycan-binding domain